MPTARAAASLPAVAAACALVCACADWSVRPTFPASAGLPVVQEQALLGLAPAGALAAQLIWADGAPPKLTLLALDAGGGPSRTVLAAPDALAQEVAAALLEKGDQLVPLLGALVSARWPEGAREAAALGYAPAAPLAPEPGRRRFPVEGAGGLPLSLRLTELPGPPVAQGLSLSEQPGGQAGGSDEVEVCQMPLAGAAVAPQVWLSRGVAWLLAGSVLGGPAEGEGAALHRTVGLRRGALGRAEAGLHNLHGLGDYGAGDLDAARREFTRALAADARFVDALYNAASVAALADRTDEAVALLRRAVAEDPRRVEVLARNDEDLQVLRRRPDVRKLLGLVRPAPGDREPLR
jgi:hypothetical protein